MVFDAIGLSKVMDTGTLFLTDRHLFLFKAIPQEVKVIPLETIREVSERIIKLGPLRIDEGIEFYDCKVVIWGKSIIDYISKVYTINLSDQNENQIDDSQHKKRSAAERMTSPDPGVKEERRNYALIFPPVGQNCFIY